MHLGNPILVLNPRTRPRHRCDRSSSDQSASTRELKDHEDATKWHRCATHRHMHATWPWPASAPWLLSRAWQESDGLSAACIMQCTRQGMQGRQTRCRWHAGGTQTARRWDPDSTRKDAGGRGRRAGRRGCEHLPTSVISDKQARGRGTAGAARGSHPNDQ